MVSETLVFQFSSSCRQENINIWNQFLSFYKVNPTFVSAKERQLQCAQGNFLYNFPSKATVVQAIKLSNLCWKNTHDATLNVTSTNFSN